VRRATTSIRTPTSKVAGNASATPSTNDPVFSVKAVAR
jgi:hypothetical protein